MTESSSYADRHERAAETFAVFVPDVDPERVKIGDRVEMTFRRLYSSDGVHNYFWKARPLRA